jgi:hypothetical protein
MLKFPLHSSPLPDESLDSWLQHLARLLECPIASLLRAAGAPDSIVGRRLTLGVADDLADLLSDATGVSSEAIHHSTLRRYHSLTLNGGVHLQLASLKTSYCPVCLLETGGRWRLSWHSLSSMVCTIHNVLLADTCPGCGSRPHPYIQHRRDHLSTSPIPTRRCPQGCLESLSGAETLDVRPGSLIIRGQQWLDTLLDKKTILFPGVGGPCESTQEVLRDINKLKKLSGKFGERFPYQAPDNGHVTAALSGLFASTKSNYQHTPQLITQTLAASAFAETDQDTAAEMLSFIPHDVRRRICYFHPTTDNPKAMTRSARYLVYRYEFTHALINPPLWHRQVLTAAPVERLSPAHLPSRIWPVVTDNHPAVPRLVGQLLPLTATVSIATLGSSRTPTTALRRLRLTLPKHLVDIELQALWSTPNRREILDYYLDLHSALSSIPPIIDYQRRREMFPTPISIPENLGLSVNERRFAWQLITGSDPFSTTGSSNRLGPTVRSYMRFFQLLPIEELRRLYETSASILYQSGVNNEPLLYAPRFENGKFDAQPLDEGTDALRSLLPGTHIVSLALAEKSRSIESVVDYAITSSGMIARALLILLEIANDPTATAAATRTSVHHVEIINAEARVEQLIGRVIFTRARAGNPRAITRAGHELFDLCKLRFEELQESNVNRGQGSRR